MKAKHSPCAYRDFKAFETEFLEPLSRRKFTRTILPLSDLNGWQVKKGLKLSAEVLAALRQAVAEGKNDPDLHELLVQLILPAVHVESLQGRYRVEGWHCQVEQGDSWDYMVPEWYQPGCVQPPGIVAQLVDESSYALVRGIWEPGNVGRGWNGSALLVDVSAKHSPGNKAQWEASGKTPPLADFVEDLRARPGAVIAQINGAPYDGARDDKANFHGMLRAPRLEIIAAVHRLEPAAHKRYAFVSPTLLNELVERGLAPIHLRDLLSLRRRHSSKSKKDR